MWAVEKELLHLNVENGFCWIIFHSNQKSKSINLKSYSYEKLISKLWQSMSPFIILDDSRRGDIDEEMLDV